MRPPLTLQVALEEWPLSAPLRITGYTFTSLTVVVVTLSDVVHFGRGEATGVFYLGETPSSLVGQIEAVREKLEAGATREELRALLPPGGARNAVDCALWELESRRTRTPVWALAGLRAPAPLLTTYTLGADTPEAMAEGAAVRYRDAPALKLKLLGDPYDAARVRAVRAARPDVWLGVDANQGLARASLADLLPSLVEARIALIEQPCKRGAEHELDNFDSPIPLAADESVQSLEEIPALVGRFQVMNIKLDKCGGLTEALLMAEEGRRRGLGIMVGNMGGTALAVAPALLVGQLCEVVDLDGPLFLKRDRVPPVVYDKGYISAPDELWGWPAGAQVD
jgi:L-alanine-DL-glutamate epimerase-like enolase superfamily enzyme